MPGFAVSCRGLGGVVDLDELVAQPALFCHMGRHSGGAVALRGMVPGGYEAHARLARKMRLGLGDFAGDENIRPCRDGRLEIPLRAARAPRHAAHGALCSGITTHITRRRQGD